MNLLPLLTEKERLLSSKHQKEVEVLTRMLHRELVSPKTYRSKLSALERIIETEKDSLQRSRQEAERLGDLIQSMSSDRRDIDRLENACQREVYPEDIMREIASEEGISRHKVDRIFNSF